MIKIGSSTNSVSDSASTTSTSTSFGFMQERYNNIMELLQQSRTTLTTNYITSIPLSMTTNTSLANGKSSIFWILDTSATDHITYHFASFITHQTIKHIHVTLPNGTHINAFIFGSIVSPHPLSSTMSCISQPLMSILF